MTHSDTGPAHEPLAVNGGGGAPEAEPVPAPAVAGPWLGSPSGIVALVALVLSVCLPPFFFPLAGLALVLAVIALVRRRPRPRSALVITIISGVLLLVVLAIGILVTMSMASTQTGMAG